MSKAKPKKVPAKKVAKKAAKKTKKPAEIAWNPDKKLSDKEELFCRYYVLNNSTRLNGAQSYNMAYDKKLDEQSKDDAVWGTREKNGVMEKYIITQSSYERVNNVCRVEASRMLSKPNIDARRVALLNELMTNEFVDGELVKVIAQDGDRPSKVRAIAEYNKLGGRIVTKESHLHEFTNETMSDTELLERVKKNQAFFNKT